MDLTLFLAKMIGLWLLIGGIGMLFNGGYYQKMLTKFVKDEVITFVSGLILLAGGLAMILTYNVWAWNWNLLLTLFGWGTFLKGAILLVLPRQMTALNVAVLKYRSLMIIGPVIWIIGGLVLAYYGFYA